jgi:hypothetical protein
MNNGVFALFRIVQRGSVADSAALSGWREVVFVDLFSAGFSSHDETIAI